MKAPDRLGVWKVYIQAEDGHGNGDADDLDLAQTARYVKLNLTQRGTGWGYSLWEFGVYG
ncbi:hypothetical protein ACWF9B_34275 [Streptomyces sp. NPDC055089]